MEIKAGLSALVTGGASGIGKTNHFFFHFNVQLFQQASVNMKFIQFNYFTGKGLVLALAEKGVFITIVDFSQEKGRETATLVQKINAKFHPNLQHPSVLFVKCDVTNSSK